YGYICTGEAFVFLYIPGGNPTLFNNLLCMPYQDAQADVQADDEVRLHRTAIGQVLAFTLQALAVEPPTQKWHDHIVESWYSSGAGSDYGGIL
ncbi:hypothetical protein ASPFODRAFT_53148, partial [Aspergillus luchuensis CBS 106.47]